MCTGKIHPAKFCCCFESWRKIKARTVKLAVSSSDPRRARKVPRSEKRAKRSVLDLQDAAKRARAETNREKKRANKIVS
jgi:hypothetical protein